MENKKNYIIIAILLLLAIFLFNRKPSIEEQLVGTWTGNQNGFFVFHEDGTGETDGYYFSWTVSEGVIYMDLWLNGEEDGQIDGVMPVTSDKLTHLQFDLSEELGWSGEEEIFLKVAD
ncbi:hypothetical protein [Streptococcus plurextorum]|uniref:hypothetical protein n=1 Tax=Streptococcus plurextorum TaxID=456876 RepID=UPI0004042014|nr:hypothetical protein [Streptococcus plurextorum]